MLVELYVENFAVVERLRVRFHPGLNLLTGETGSGKSIVVDSLGLLFGGRASAEVVRTGTDRARVSGIFVAPPDPAFRSLLEEAGIALEEDELIVEREVTAGGKSRALLANRPVTATLLKALAPWLGDIHGQNEQQRLHSPESQREMLDTFAGCGSVVAEVGELFTAWRDCARELEEIDRAEQEQLRLADLWSFQRKEIEEVDPQVGEDVELEAEKRVLQNVTRLAEHAEAAYTALYDAPDSAVAQARIAAKRVQELVRIDPSLAEVAELLRPAVIGLEEAGFTLRDYLGKLHGDPRRLDEVETRLAAMDRLRRKYGTTIEEILEFLGALRGKMQTVAEAGERRAAIEARREKLAGEYTAAAGRLTKARKEAAKKLEKRVEKELAALAMAGTRFQVAFAVAGWSAEGVDAVRFLVSANVGEEPRELDKVASGGEVSRIALAIKTCIESERPGASQHLLVFDEVDAGIGGEASEAVGRRLKGLSRSNQVLCVTHQANIASFADHHYRVEKQQAHGRTVAVMTELTGEERTREIGRMLSGQRLTPEALRHAEQLIQAGALA
jgi:DNA repair protein RecN (Recombination protein N)